MEIFVGLVMLGAIIAVAYYAFVSEFHTSQTIQSPNLSSQSFTQNEPTPEAVEHFDRAVDMLQKSGSGKLDDTLKLDVASELALAVKKADAPFPAAYALLAMMMNEMGKDADAERYARIALQQNPNEFRAQLVLIDVAVENVQILNLRPGHFLHFESPKGRDLAEQIVGSAVGTILGTAVKSASTLAQSGWAANKQAKFKDELVRLIMIFKNCCETNTDSNEFIFMGETLIGLGDWIKDLSLFGGRPDMYSPVANANIEKLRETAKEKEVIAVINKAQGRLLVLGKR